ncbi:regulatory protein RecX [Konateibacter massiliensis]|uniref:regulatory protein RecX n=1 Tax=Konateibacter massiliensis TaxID=2002841 RepID=UPI000C160905|nr:regulatory protein RecX [Konateibacter massiliensis]
MLVTAIEEYTKGRYKIYLDEQFAFVLYKGELHSFKIELNTELAEEDYFSIKNEVILKRAKRRTLYLLKKMDKTEQELRNKLKEGFYPEDIIEQAIAYVKGYHYINDERYAERYIGYKSKYKSKMEITSELRQKGISKELIKQVYEDRDESEVEVIIKLIKKKITNINEADQNQIRKLYMYLCRKGFKYDEIDEAIEALKKEE